MVNHSLKKMWISLVGFGIRNIWYFFVGLGWGVGFGSTQRYRQWVSRSLNDVLNPWYVCTRFNTDACFILQLLVLGKEVDD